MMPLRRIGRALTIATPWLIALALLAGCEEPPRDLPAATTAPPRTVTARSTASTQAAAVQPSSSKSTAPPLGATPAAVVEGNTRFALELYQTLARDRAGKNLFVSPFSISTALAMTFAGAAGQTEKQMANTLHFALEQAALHPAMKALIAPLQAERADRGFELSVANALWGQQGVEFRKPFLATTRDHYGAGLQLVDFLDPGGAAKTINGWVEEQTHHKIKNLVSPGAVKGASLVLTTAIYFKGDWARQFKPADTKPAPFHVTPERDVQAPLMVQEGSFRYAESPELQLLELPYLGKELSMVIFLPRKVGDLTALEGKLTAALYTSLLEKLRGTEVHVYLPKFRLDTSFNLGDTLKTMGMTAPFEASADFSGMTEQKKLFISSVVHKAFVDVNEEGTEAAAATAVTTTEEWAPPKPKQFRADHPFVFAIRHRPTGSVLFLGRLSSPASS